MLDRLMKFPNHVMGSFQLVVLIPFSTGVVISCKEIREQLLNLVSLTELEYLKGRPLRPTRSWPKTFPPSVTMMAAMTMLSGASSIIARLATTISTKRFKQPRIFDSS